MDEKPLDSDAWCFFSFLSFLDLPKENKLENPLFFLGAKSNVSGIGGGDVGECEGKKMILLRDLERRLHRPCSRLGVIFSVVGSVLLFDGGGSSKSPSGALERFDKDAQECKPFWK